MRRLSFLLIFCTSSLWGAWSTPIQSGNNNSAGGTPSVTLGSNVVAADNLIAQMICEQVSGTPSVSDGLNGSYTSLGCAVDNVNSQTTFCTFYIGSSAAGSDTISGNCNTANDGELFVSEFSGGATSNVLDSSSTLMGFAGTPIGPTFTTNVNGDLVYASVFIGNSAASAGSGFTAINNISGIWVDEYQNQSTAGSTVAQFTNGSSGGGAWFVTALALKVAAAPVVATPNNLLKITGGKVAIQGGKVSVQ